jgi:hypothetical protein
MAVGFWNTPVQFMGLDPSDVAAKVAAQPDVDRETGAAFTQIAADPQEYRRDGGPEGAIVTISANGRGDCHPGSLYKVPGARRPIEDGVSEVGTEVRIARHLHHTGAYLVQWRPWLCRTDD